MTHKVVSVELKIPRVYIITCACGKKWYSTRKRNNVCPVKTDQELEESWRLKDE